jgi:uncharacterized integral membrane protein
MMPELNATRKRPWLRWLGRILLVVIGLLCTAWGTAALWFDFPREGWKIPLIVLYLAAVVVGLWFLRGTWRRFVWAAGCFLVVLVWWRSLKPSNDREWQADVAKTPWSEVSGDQVTIHNIRSCDYRAEFDYTCQWLTRTVDLSKIDGMDVFITYWGSPWIAHPIVSFEVAGEEPIPMSIETRKEVGETYSAVRGFFRYYELIYIVSTERDVVRLRTNYRHGEEVYLFHTKATPLLSQKVFLDYLRRANRLHNHAEWYNAATDNCTTNVALHVRDAENGVLPMDWRILLNGKSDEMLYQQGYLAGDLPYVKLKEEAHINAAARAANDDPNFSRRVREGRPGFPAAPAIAVQPVSH